MECARLSNVVESIKFARTWVNVIFVWSSSERFKALPLEDFFFSLCDSILIEVFLRLFTFLILKKKKKHQQPQRSSYSNLLAIIVNLLLNRLMYSQLFASKFTPDFNFIYFFFSQNMHSMHSMKPKE